MGNMVVSILRPGDKPTPAQIKRIRAAAKRPIVYDEDCPELTDEQLAEFVSVAKRREESRKKQVLSLRVASDTIRIGKSFGRGWTGIMARLLDLAVRDAALLRRAL